MKRLALLFPIVFLLCACQRKETNDLWGTQIEYIQWGMSPEEIHKYYDCSDAAQEVAPNISYLPLKESVKIYGCNMDIILIFETGYGLVGIKGQTIDVEKLKKNIEKELGEYRSGTELSNGVIWHSGLVMEQYSYQQLTDACNQVYGEGVYSESFINGILGSPFVSYELKTTEERAGELWINGSKLVYLNQLFDNSEEGENNDEKN